MNYVIAGAGEVGTYLASWLSSSEHNVIVIEKDLEKLTRVSQELDVKVYAGSATDLKILSKVIDIHPDVFLAVTDQDEVNLLACAMAKHLGVAQTIARVKDPQYLSQDKIDFQALFMIDHIICPDWSAAQALLSVVQSEGDYGCEFFAGGAIQMRRFRLGASWRKERTPLKELDIPSSFRVAVIKRYVAGEPKVIFPHGDDHLLVEDEITLIGQTHAMHEADSYFDQQILRKESVYLAGGSRVTLCLALALEKSDQNYRITLVAPDKKSCEEASRLLTKTQVFHQSHLSTDFLRSTQVDQFDLFIASSRDEHLNITSCTLAKEVGAMSCAAIIQHGDMSELARSLQIQSTVCPSDYIASQIIKLASGAKISSVSSVYSHRAEVIELHLGQNSRLTGIPLNRLARQLPHELLIGVVQHRGKTVLASGSTILCPGDTVIAVCSPQHLEWIQKMV